MTSGSIVLLVLFAFSAGFVLGMFLGLDCRECDEDEQPIRRDQ